MALPRTANIPGFAPAPDQRDKQRRDRDRDAHVNANANALAAARRAQAAKRRADDARRIAGTGAQPHPHLLHNHHRRPSLRRVKDSTEQLRTTRARGASNATIDSALSLSASHAGRSFTVANINNGIIYLRPVVRPGHQRSGPPPEPIFPQTPPDSASLDTSLRPTSDDWEKSVFGPRTPTRADITLPQPAVVTKGTVDADSKAPNPTRLDSPPPPSSHVRSHSFSTSDNHTISSHSVEPGTFKVVIDRPPQRRPKTADTGAYPLLEVPIPHYRLGTPRFSARGTAILRSSVYTSAAGTDDRSSLLTPQRASHSFLSSRPRSEVFTPSFNFPTTIAMDLKPPHPSSEPSSARISKLPIGPQIYDSLTADPDDRAAVRFSATGDILAATPSRLVAHITSPSFLDYELLSDFFLTFRSFMSSRELVAYLLSRLRWAVDRQDDFGRIVRVRTFVALRHWILNYFVDDFVPKYRLRLYFCELVNALYQDLKAREDKGGGDIKIVGELKKCWRRTCTLYWDSEDATGQDSADADLLPGGQPASQMSVDEPPYSLPMPSTPPRQTNHNSRVETIGSNPSDQFASRHMDWAQRARHTPQNSLSSPYLPSSQEMSSVRVPLSPESERSLQVLSCSIPMKGLGRPEPANDAPLYPHPVPHPVPSSHPRTAPSPPQSTSPKKPGRPSHGHKRSGSFSDALRDNRTPLSLPKYGPSDLDITTMSAISKIPGSLVRGGLFQPSSPYIDVKNGGLRHTRSRLELAHQNNSTSDVQLRGAYATNPGMKKLIGSVRRALSSKQPGGSSPQFSHTFQHRHTSSARSSHLASLSTVSDGVQKRRQPRPRPQMRIDILASAVAESFQKALKEQMKNENLVAEAPNLAGFEFNFDGPAPQPGDGQNKEMEFSHMRSHSGITNGSKSILIMDDTGPPPLPLMSGALPGLGIEPASTTTSSVTTGLAEAAPIVEKPIETSVRHSDLYKDAGHESMPSWQQASRPSIQGSASALRRSLSAGREQMHSFRWRGSTRTSMARPASLRRHASHASGLSRHQQVASIATFQTMSSDNDPFHLERQPTDASLRPARQLRRRPGGDLRAADNVHDLEQDQRPHSTGSVSNCTHSITNSVVLRSDRFIESRQESGQEVNAQDQPDDSNPSDQPTDEASDDSKKKKTLSLVDTHSSQPNLRPSFEAEVAKLAALPDDIDDDGGIEAALMKLEGRYEKKSPDPSEATPAQSPKVVFAPQVYRPTGAPAEVTVSSYPSSGHDSGPRLTPRDDDALHRPLAPPGSEGGEMYRLSGEAFNSRVPPVNSAIGSDDSYSSIPLLDRGVSGVTSSQRVHTLDTMRSSAKPAPLNPASLPSQAGATPEVASPGSFTEHAIKTDSMNGTSSHERVPKSSVPRQSFLLDADEDLSDVPSDHTNQREQSFLEDPTPLEMNDAEFLPTHPMRHPPTPPLTANRLKDSLPQVDTTVLDRGLPTPGLTPTSRFNTQTFEPTNKGMEPPIELQEMKKEDRFPSSDPPHLPFILAYDSETLAQQFTIIEKDALDEIDWRELVELRWKQSSPQIRDWVHYLCTQEARGVDVAIARFNLVVKWAVSELVLTENLEERARCIVKYIHIAAHLRKLRNYATMYQITIALLSNDISRLRKTWSLVPAAELQTMRELEALIQPLKNFHALRVEMESATVEEGCIPFIGIYTRDLIYNAQKPAFIDAPPANGERLINFERHHTAATIVKSLLRLLEASSKYAFNVEPNIISKCLWLAALSDDEITKRSRLHE